MFERLFGRKSTSSKLDLTKDLKYGDLETRSLAEIIAALKEAGNHFSMRTTAHLSRRLLDIGLIDVTTADAERAPALELEKSVWSALEQVALGNPPLYDACKEAREMMLQQGREVGVFSLAHKIQKLPSDKVASEIVKLANAPLLRNFPKKLVERHRAELITELIRSRLPPREPLVPEHLDRWIIGLLKNSNGVIASGWLLLTRDPTAHWIFEAEEKHKLIRFLDDYASARQVLIDLGIISGAEPLSFLPAPDPAACHMLLLHSCAVKDTRLFAEQRGDDREKLRGLDRGSREAFLAIVSCLRAFIWQKTLRSAYGDEYLSLVLAVIAETEWGVRSAEVLTQMQKVYDLCIADDAKDLAFHTALVAQFTLELLDRTLPDSDNDDFVQAFTTIFTDELLHFPHYLRFLLRFAAHGETSGEAAMCEDQVI